MSSPAKGTARSGDSLRSAGEDAGRRTESAAQDVADSPTARRYARAGIAARALVYLIIGIVTIRIALGAAGDSGASTSQSASATGAIKALAGLPGGRILLGIQAVGLAGYVVFSALDVCLHRRGRNREERAGMALIAAASGVLYAVFAVWTATLVLDPAKRHQNSDQGSTAFSARVMGWPMGRELVAATGVVVVGIAVGFAWTGISRRFLEHLDDDRPSGRARDRLTALGVVAYVGRGLAFAVTGCCLVLAAIRFDPSQAEGLDGSLRSVSRSGAGQVLLFAVAAGLICFAAYLAAEVRFRKI
jgi:hypothetical protein